MVKWNGNENKKENCLYNLFGGLPKATLIKNPIKHLSCCIDLCIWWTCSILAYKHAFQTSLWLKQRLQRDKICCKSSDPWTRQLFFLCVLPHKVEDPSMIIYKFTNIYCLLYTFFYPRNFTHEVNAMGSTRGPKQVAVPLHKKFTNNDINCCIICHYLHHILLTHLLQHFLH